MNTITIIIIAVVGIALGYWLARFRQGFSEASPPFWNRSGVVKEAELNQREKKKENKQKILDFLRNRESVKNNDIEKLLGVSDATATNYMDELEREGKVEQVGSTGIGVYYKLRK
ncbi:MAG: FaeA/PapI family transcriptional regulator [Candidatus Paceibacteria bacterium]